MQLELGVAHTMSYQVRRRDLVCFQYTHGGPLGWIRWLWLSVVGQRPQPSARIWRGKPKVQATGNLIGVLEWVAMDAARAHLRAGEDVLGTSVDIAHQAPMWRGLTLTITARCIAVAGNRSRWHVVAEYPRGDEQVVVAQGTLGFSTVVVSAFLARHAPSPWIRWRAQPRWRHRVWVAATALVARPYQAAGGRHRRSCTYTAAPAESCSGVTSTDSVSSTQAILQVSPRKATSSSTGNVYTLPRASSARE
jgi:predicted thioesterase